MSTATEEGSPRHRLRVALVRLISIADRPDDDDDGRLRKRVGVAAGYFTIVAPLGAPLAAATPLVAWALRSGCRCGVPPTSWFSRERSDSIVTSSP